MRKIEDVLWKGEPFTFRSKDLTTGPVPGFAARLFKVFKQESEEKQLNDPALEVLNEVIATLHSSQAWYVSHDQEDGTPVMYAADVINRLRTVYGLPD